MSFVKKYKIFIVAISLLTLVFIYQWLTEKRISFLSTSDYTLYIAAFFSVFGIGGKIFEAGTFDFFMYSVEYLKRMLQPHKYDLTTPIKRKQLSQAVGKAYIFPLRLTIIFFLISLMSLLLHYTFEV